MTSPSSLSELHKPNTFVYQFQDEDPPRVDRYLKAGFEVVESKPCTVVTYWFFWDHDFEGDGVENWEPVSVVIRNREVVDVQSRPHWKLVSWAGADPETHDGRPIVYFSKNRHAPYLVPKMDTSDSWLQRQLKRIPALRRTAWAAPDFLAVHSSLDEYVKVEDYQIRHEAIPPRDHRSRKGFAGGLGREWYKMPHGC